MTHIDPKVFNFCQTIVDSGQKEVVKRSTFAENWSILIKKEYIMVECGSILVKNNQLWLKKSLFWSKKGLG